MKEQHEEDRDHEQANERDKIRQREDLVRHLVGLVRAHALSPSSKRKRASKRPESHRILYR